MLTAHLWREPGAIRPLTRGAEAGSIDSAPIRIGWYVRMQACLPAPQGEPWNCSLVQDGEPRFRTRRSGGRSRPSSRTGMSGGASTGWFTRARRCRVRLWWSGARMRSTSVTGSSERIPAADCAATTRSAGSQRLAGSQWVGWQQAGYTDRAGHARTNCAACPGNGCLTACPCANLPRDLSWERVR